MSKLFKKLFGSKNKEEKALTPAEAIQRQKATQEMLTKKQVYLEKRIDEEVKTAKDNVKKNKRVALIALKKKKRYEEQLRKLDSTMQTIDLQLESLQSASIDTVVFQGLKVATAALKTAHQKMDPEKVHELMDDIHDEYDISQEISEAISDPTGTGLQYDEDELLAELDGLLQVEERSNIKLPDVPTEEPRGAVTTKATASKPHEDDELKELEAWAS